VRKELNLTNKNIFLYVPTFRDEFERSHNIDYSVYDLDFKGIYDALLEKFGGDWILLVKFHPIMQIYIKDYQPFNLPFVKDVTSYVNIQALVSASDFVVTDYSSTVCDALIAGIPGLTIALDYDQYKEERNFYFDLQELPFPFAKSNSELIYNIKYFNKEDYLTMCEAFKDRIGLCETGHAAKDVAERICEFLATGRVNWNRE
jgi:CDP-glycerol glycerophosphotransferase